MYADLFPAIIAEYNIVREDNLIFLGITCLSPEKRKSGRWDLNP